MHVSCVFNPPVDGKEDHDDFGVHLAIGEDSVKRYTYTKDETFCIWLHGCHFKPWI